MSVIQDVLSKLSHVPGLGFLRDYSQKIGNVRQGIEMQIGDNKNRVDNIREAGRSVKGAVSGKGKKTEND